MHHQTQKQAVIYCRVSTKEQAEEGNSLVTQERNCREYAHKHGYEVAATFIEQGESAKTADRTELKKLLAFCTSKKNGVQAVITYKIDRISRNTDDYSHIRMLLRKYKVEIKSTSEVFSDTPAGRFMENIIANVAQFDNDVRTERSVGGMKEAVREGRYVWMAPYGYSNVRVNGKATIAPNENAGYVKEAFTLVATGQHSVRAIWKHLAVKGMRTVRGNVMPQSYFYTMLQNKLYTGWIEKFGEQYRGSFTPIITEGLFHAVQRIRSRKSPATFIRRTDNPDFPLRNFFRHPSGKVLTGSWSQGNQKKYPYYLIHGHHINIRKEALESTFAGWLNNFRLDVDYFETLKKKVHTCNETRIQAHTKVTEAIPAQIEKLKAKQELILEKNLAGVINDIVAREHINRLQAEVYQLEQQQIQQATAPADSVLSEAVREILQRPGDAWMQADIQGKKKLQWFYFPDGIEIEKTQSRTQKICKLFKVKKEISPCFSSNVHQSFRKSNMGFSQVLQIRDSIHFNKELSLEETLEELAKLNAIVNDTEETTSQQENIRM